MSDDRRTKQFREAFAKIDPDECIKDLEEIVSEMRDDKDNIFRLLPSQTMRLEEMV